MAAAMVIKDRRRRRQLGPIEAKSNFAFGTADLPLLDLFRPYIAKSGTDIEDPLSRADAPILAGFPSARLHDVWTLQDRVREALPGVRVPVLIAIARQDHVVSLKGARELARGLKQAPQVQWLELAEGFHIVPRDRGLSILADKIASFFEESQVESSAAF